MYYRLFIAKALAIDPAPGYQRISIAETHIRAPDAGEPII
jgi:hypothetical protein